MIEGRDSCEAFILGLDEDLVTDPKVVVLEDLDLFGGEGSVPAQLRLEEGRRLLVEALSQQDPRKAFLGVDVALESLPVTCDRCVARFTVSLHLEVKLEARAVRELPELRVESNDAQKRAFLLLQGLDSGLEPRQVSNLLHFHQDLVAVVLVVQVLDSDVGLTFVD